MYRVISYILLILLVSGPSIQAQKKSPAGQQKPPTSFIDTVLRYLGIADSPGTLKGPGDDVVSGELWLADLRARTTRPLISGEGYHSPIFLEGNKDVLALRGTDIMRIPSAGGESTRLYSIDGILKLVGISSEGSATALILLAGGAKGHPRVAQLTVSTGFVTPVPYDSASHQDLQIVEDLEGWSRTYGDRHIYVRKQSKKALLSTIEWSDVFLQVEGQSPMDVSQCEGVNCGQPSLSPDGSWLVFVRANSQ